MRKSLVLTFSLVIAGLPCLAAQTALSSPASPVQAPPLPYVYTKWKQFTTADGLPNDHIFAVKAHGNKVWVGTEDGLACLDKRFGLGRRRGLLPQTSGAPSARSRFQQCAGNRIEPSHDGRR